MRPLIDIFQQNLQNSLQLEVALSFDQGIYKLALDPYLLDLYVYPYAVQDRIAGIPNRKTIHIDEDVLETAQDKIVSRLKSISGQAIKVFARQTVCARIDKKVAIAFQSEHHVQYPLPGKYRYGLYDQGELISVAIFSGGRRMSNRPEDYRSFELLRLCHKSNVLAIGGVSKLIKAFQKDFHPGDIMTYVDCDWTEDSSLKQVGFVEKDRLVPQLFYVRDGQRTREEVAGYFPKYNSGSIKMVLYCQEEL